MSVRTYSFFHDRSYKWIQSLSNGLFLYLFLLAFLPFGVSNYNPNHQYTISFLSELAIFGIITIVASLLNEFILKKLLPNPARSSHVLLWSAWTILSLGIILFIAYNYVGNWHDWRLGSGITFVIEVAMVFIFPIGGTLIYFNFRALKDKYDAILTSESDINTQKLIQFKGEGSNDQLGVAINDFLFARAQDNYVELHYLQNGESRKELFRSKLSALLSQTEGDFIVRSHRSYIVNLLSVTSIKGRSSDLKLFMKDTSEPIPVSKTYLDETIAALKRHKQFH